MTSGTVCPPGVTPSPPRPGRDGRIARCPAPPSAPKPLVVSSFDDTAVRRAHRGGDLVRLAPGPYVRAGLWALLDAPDRHALRAVAAISASAHPLVAQRRLPPCGGWVALLLPERVHLLDTRASTTQTTSRREAPRRARGVAGARALRDPGHVARPDRSRPRGTFRPASRRRRTGRRVPPGVVHGQRAPRGARSPRGAPRGGTG